MLEISIPAAERMCLEHLVLDYNGTLAVDGALLPGVSEALRQLAGQLTIHVITADTFGHAREALATLPCTLTILHAEGQNAAKLAYLRNLGADRCAAIGNGRNDRSMIGYAALGIAVIQKEGAAVETMLAAKVVAPDINSALELLLNPQRLVATLRL
ncbi:HAD family hydrolase [Ferrovum myxofaciens]|uniref:HAD family hydrolase n=1 Tax=Ferrovum myxofaciens TaxID=416213 RepID=UPI002353AFEE|nr:HAD hydrolase family protein [Ferrovum myxofaciens]